MDSRGPGRQKGRTLRGWIDNWKEVEESFQVSVVFPLPLFHVFRFTNWVVVNLRVITFLSRKEVS